jgi:hypothetical protein
MYKKIIFISSSILISHLNLFAIPIISHNLDNSAFSINNNINLNLKYKKSLINYLVDKGLGKKNAIQMVNNSLPFNKSKIELAINNLKLLMNDKDLIISLSNKILFKKDILLNDYGFLVSLMQSVNIKNINYDLIQKVAKLNNNILI